MTSAFTPHCGDVQVTAASADGVIPTPLLWLQLSESSLSSVWAVTVKVPPAPWLVLLKNFCLAVWKVKGQWAGRCQVKQTERAACLAVKLHDGVKYQLDFLSAGGSQPKQRLYGKRTFDEEEKLLDGRSQMNWEGSREKYFSTS